MLRRFAIAALVGGMMASAGSAAAQETITGAGATFPYPIYSKWASAYQKETGIQMNYQSIGSGGGIKQIKAKTVDFGASDAPLTKEELDEAGLIQWPQIMGGEVLTFNLDGIAPGGLKLDGPTIADIYLGKITKWNDPAIATLNPDVDLPNTLITVVHRSDGSGTTFIFTHYLSQVSDEWKQQVGFNKAVAWPAGVGGKGNEGVAAYVKQIPGAIGYVEYAYAMENKLAYADMINSAGSVVEPTSEAFQAAAANADWANAPGYYLILTDQPGEASWPITGASFILMHKTQADPATALRVLEFFDWSFANGDDMAGELAYVPIPDSVVELIHEEWKADLKAEAGSPIWKQ